jgi:hypothetical protein
MQNDEVNKVKHSCYSYYDVNNIIGIILLNCYSVALKMSQTFLLDIFYVICRAVISLEITVIEYKVSSTFLSDIDKSLLDHMGLDHDLCFSSNKKYGKNM